MRGLLGASMALGLVGMLLSGCAKTPEAQKADDEIAARYPLKSLGYNHRNTHIVNTEVIRDKITGCEWLVFDARGTAVQPRMEPGPNGTRQQRCGSREAQSPEVPMINREK